MGKFRKKPVEIEATQWFKNGDHPEDNSEMIEPDICSVTKYAPFLSEGKVVRRYRHPSECGSSKCRYCGGQMHVHGWIFTMEGGHIVCPGDWIITGINGERYPVKNDYFQKTYEAVEN